MKRPWVVVAYEGAREVGRWHYATKASAERAVESTASGGFLVVVRNLDDPVESEDVTPADKEPETDDLWDGEPFPPEP